jgi:hypothetical protein
MAVIIFLNFIRAQSLGNLNDHLDSCLTQNLLLNEDEKVESKPSRSISDYGGPTNVETQQPTTEPHIPSPYGKIPRTDKQKERERKSASLDLASTHTSTSKSADKNITKVVVKEDGLSLERPNRKQDNMVFLLKEEVLTVIQEAINNIFSSDWAENFKKSVSVLSRQRTDYAGSTQK